jgi:hypothetical protein
MKDLNEVKLLELSTTDSFLITGGALGTGQSSLLRSAAYLGIAATHAVADYAAGFINRFLANSKYN